jgi:signal transduction histidine kinase
MGTGEDAVQTERRRIAELIHDGPVQELTAAQMLIETAVTQSLAARDDAMLQRGLEMLRAAVLSCRTLMRDLAGDEPDA